MRELERDKQGAASGAGDPEAGRGFLCQGDRSTVTRFRFVEVEAAQFPVSLLCTSRSVSLVRAFTPGGAGRNRARRELADRKLDRADPTRSTPRRTRSMARRGFYSELKLERRHPRSARKRVARLMRQLGIRGADGRRGGPRTTRPRSKARPSAPGPRRPTTSSERSRTGSGCATSNTSRPVRASSSSPYVQDVFSRRIIGWSMRDDLKAELVLDALGMAINARGGDDRRRGRAFRSRLAVHESRLRQPTPSSQGSTSRWAQIGDPWDNADRRELLRQASRNKSFAASDSRPASKPGYRVFWYIECFYNPRRRHSSLGMLSPIDYEHQHQQEASPWSCPSCVCKSRWVGPCRGRCRGGLSSCRS